MISILFLLAAASADPFTPVTPYDKLCQVNANFNNSVDSDRALWNHPELFADVLGPKLAEARAKARIRLETVSKAPDLIQYLPKEEQAAARAACIAEGQRIIATPLPIKFVPCSEAHNAKAACVSVKSGK